MTSPTVREIEKGPHFEINKGPQCLQRLDWTREGALRATYMGRIEPWCAGPFIQRMEAFVRAKQRITLCNDFWEATGYESGYRLACTAWAKQHPGAQAGIHFLTRSKLLNMGVTVAALALPEQVKTYSKRQDFDLLLKRLGLPVTVAMPTFVPET